MKAVLLPVDEVRRCAGDARFAAEMELLYSELAAEIAARRPVCVNRGACCRFGEYGHRLYVTPAEVAYFLARSGGAVRSPDGSDACPYQQGGRCTARDGRPSGCRIFFCDPRARDWQPGLSEEVLQRLRDLHARFRLPYTYLEWFEALRQAAAV